MMIILERGKNVIWFIMIIDMWKWLIWDEVVENAGKLLPSNGEMWELQAETAFSTQRDWTEAQVQYWGEQRSEVTVGWQ